MYILVGRGHSGLVRSGEAMAETMRAWQVKEARARFSEIEL
jgi:hypothetical protein